MPITVLDGNGDPVTINQIADLMALIGEVTPEPTANTMQDRLKTLADQLDVLHTDNAALATYIDGLETLVGISNVKLDAVVAALAGRSKSIKSVSGSLTADADIVTAVAGKRIKVIAYSLISSGTNSNPLIFKSNAATEIWRTRLQAPALNSLFGANLAVEAPSWLFATAAGEKLSIDVGNTDTVDYAISYFDDDAS
ncbi:hypothetical protein JQ633_12565 [Bradyrhizobium tropiciagri]|uniref:hypothetical protein n=1 Tax=Bradyrhizobium tropiciagri TaxID=312253 RepID=UPI001BA60ED5|nr:hypothetical protein [Bradyrhizobium tropiciagri]MBR0871196.1 hypothetical protein [Bradyrhizobium tropiciagri]